jgi:CRISPR-associated protein Csx10
MHLITYDIQLLEPLLVTSLDGDPNSSVAYDFIPGSVLRGAFISQYQSQHGAFDIGQVRSLFFSPQTQFLNGYRTVYDTDALEDRQGWPLPRSLWREKPKQKPETSFTVYDYAWGTSPSDDHTRLKTAAYGLIDSKGHLAQIERQVTIHIQRDRHMGRSIRESGQIYNYEALAPGQTFRAQILTELDEDDLAPLIDLLSGEMHLGGSRSAGYGRVRLTPVSDAPSSETWLSDCIRPFSGDNLVVTLLSDLLLRDVNGNWTTDPALLAETLGLTLKTAFVAARPIGAFNRKWGLPLPQRMAFQMGSVLVCKKPSETQWQALATTVRQGMGESREDGFGRLALNWHTQPSFIMGKPEEEKVEAVALTEGSASHKIATQMAMQLWRQQLDTAVTAEANKLARRQTKISKSQLYRLRLKIQAALQTVQQAQTQKQPDKILAAVKQDIDRYIADVTGRRSTREQFNKTRVGRKRLLKWVAELLEQTPESMPATPPFNQSGVEIGGVRAQWNQQLMLEYNLRLIDGVLANMAKLSQKENRHG